MTRVTDTYIVLQMPQLLLHASFGFHPSFSLSTMVRLQEVAATSKKHPLTHSPVPHPHGCFLSSSGYPVGTCHIFRRESHRNCSPHKQNLAVGVAGVRTHLVCSKCRSIVSKIHSLNDSVSSLKSFLLACLCTEDVC